MLQLEIKTHVLWSKGEFVEHFILQALEVSRFIMCGPSNLNVKTQIGPLSKNLLSLAVTATPSTFASTF